MSEGIAGPNAPLEDMCSNCHAPREAGGGLCSRCGWSEDRQWRCCFECGESVRLLSGTDLDTDHLLRCAGLIGVLMAVLGNLTGALSLGLAIASISRFYEGWTTGYRCEECEAEAPLHALTSVEVRTRDEKKVSGLAQALLFAILSLTTTVMSPGPGDDGPGPPPDIAAIQEEGASGIPDLVDALADARVRDQAIRALQESGLAAVPWLVDAQEDVNLEICAAAARALVHFGRDAVDGVPVLVRNLHQDPGWKSPYGAALAAIGPEAAVPLGEALAEGSINFRKRALALLRGYGEEAGPAAAAVAAELSAQDPDIRREAALTLRSMGAGAGGASEALLAALGDDAVEVRTHAAATLGEIGADAPGVVDRLARVVIGRDPEARMAAVDALQAIGLPARTAVPALNEARDKASTAERVRIDRALRALGGNQ